MIWPQIFFKFIFLILQNFLNSFFTYYICIFILFRSKHLIEKKIKSHVKSKKKIKSPTQLFHGQNTHHSQHSKLSFDGFHGAVVATNITTIFAIVSSFFTAFAFATTTQHLEQCGHGFASMANLHCLINREPPHQQHRHKPLHYYKSCSSTLQPSPHCAPTPNRDHYATIIAFLTQPALPQSCSLSSTSLPSRAIMLCPCNHGGLTPSKTKLLPVLCFSTNPRSMVLWGSWQQP